MMLYINWRFTYLLDQTTRLITRVVWTFIGTCSCYNNYQYSTFILPNILNTILFSCWKCWIHGVASMGHWGTCTPPSIFIYFLVVTSEPHKLWVSFIGLYVVAYPHQNIQACSIVTVYCMNGCHIKLFSLSFVSLLARNPGDATGRMQQHG